MRTTSATSWIAIVFGAIAAPNLAFAADLPAQPVAPPSAPAAYAPAAPDWIVTIGAEGRIVPAWAGATNSKPALTGFPLFSVRKQGSPPDFPGARDSIGFSIFDIGPVKIGPAIKFIWKREAGSYRELNGLGDVNYAVQAGAFAEYWPVSWLRLRGEVRQGFDGEKGVTGDVFLDAVVPVGQWTLSAGPRMTLQSTAAIGPYFSISDTQSFNSVVAGLPALAPYHASGGFYSYGAGTMVQYTFNPQWTVHALFEYEHLMNGAADSPLVIQRGSPDQFTYGLGATYSFSMHPWW